MAERCKCQINSGRTSIVSLRKAVAPPESTRSAVTQWMDHGMSSRPSLASVGNGAPITFERVLINLKLFKLTAPKQLRVLRSCKGRKQTHQGTPERDLQSCKSSLFRAIIETPKLSRVF